MIYPIGRQNFENLRNEGCVYVDKTALMLASSSISLSKTVCSSSSVMPHILWYAVSIIQERGVEN